MKSPAAVRHTDHAVQFFGQDDRRLVLNVAAYLAGSLRNGGAALIVADGSHRSAFEKELESIMTGDGWPQRLIRRDGAETLASFMVDGRPSRELFDTTVGDVVRQLCRQFGGLRVYGEMVGRLWAEGAFSAAIELEQLWNDLLQCGNFELFCGYPIDVLGDDFQTPIVAPILAQHRRVVSAFGDQFSVAVRRAIRETLGDGRHGVYPFATENVRRIETELPESEATILRLRSALPRTADAILTKARGYAVE